MGGLQGRIHPHRFLNIGAKPLVRENLIERLDNRVFVYP